MVLKRIIYFYLRYLQRINTPKALIKYAVKKNGDKIICVKDGEKVTLHHVNENANRISGKLAVLGLKKGDKIGVWLHNCVEYIEIRLACYKCGFIFCALIDDFTTDQAMEVLQETDCKVLFYDTSLDISRFKESNTPQILYYIHINEHVKLSNSVAFSEFMDKQLCDEPKINIKPGELSAIGFTSGTTGKCKGVVWTHKAWLYSFYHFLLNNRGSLGENSVFLHVVPFSTAGSLVLFPALVSGVKSIFLQTFNKIEVANIIEKEKVTHVILPPSFLIELWDFYVANLNDYSFSSLQSISVGSAILHGKKWEDMIHTFGPIIQQSYGMAEVLAPLAFLKIENPAKQNNLLKSVGKPVPQIKIKLIEKNGDNTGTISISSPTSAIAYWKREELTKKHFHKNYFITTDLGYMDRKGYLFILDRKVNVIDLNGITIIPRKVEEVIHGIPGVKEVCVAKKEDELTAFISERIGYTLDMDEIKKYCLTQLPLNHVPAKYVILESLPHSSSGKILRDVLMKP
jgi:acyl-CoA synthetase (AMP-forming)/AMP-acid ligase II